MDFLRAAYCGSDRPTGAGREESFGWDVILKDTRVLGCRRFTIQRLYIRVHPCHDHIISECKPVAADCLIPHAQQWKA